MPLAFYNGRKSIFKGGIFVVALLCFGIRQLDPKIHPEKYIETVRKTLKKKNDVGRTGPPNIQYVVPEAGDWPWGQSRGVRTRPTDSGNRGKCEMKPQSPGRKHETSSSSSCESKSEAINKRTDAFADKSIKYFSMDRVTRSHSKR